MKYPYILMNSHFLRVAQGYNLYKLLILVKSTPSKLNPPKTAAWLRIDLPKNCRVSFIYNGLSTRLCVPLHVGVFGIIYILRHTRNSNKKSYIKH